VVLVQQSGEQSAVEHPPGKLPFDTCAYIDPEREAPLESNGKAR